MNWKERLPARPSSRERAGALAIRHERSDAHSGFSGDESVLSVEVTVPECLRALLSSFLCVPWDLVVADPVLVRVLADSAYRRYLTRGTSQ